MTAVHLIEHFDYVSALKIHFFVPQKRKSTDFEAAKLCNTSVGLPVACVLCLFLAPPAMYVLQLTPH